MKNIVIYVHGKGGSAAEAEHYRQLFPDSEVIGFDYHAQTPWEAKEEFPEFLAQQRKHCDRLTLVANSIGTSNGTISAFSPSPAILSCKYCAVRSSSGLPPVRI